LKLKMCQDLKEKYDHLKREIQDKKATNINLIPRDDG